MDGDRRGAAGGARGFGFGWLAMLSAVGSGWSAILYGTILHPNGISWRVLYLAAVPVPSSCSHSDRWPAPSSSPLDSPRQAGANWKRSPLTSPAQMRRRRRPKLGPGSSAAAGRPLYASDLVGCS